MGNGSDQLLGIVYYLYKDLKSQVNCNFPSTWHYVFCRKVA